jgi:hypothetical protein
MWLKIGSALAFLVLATAASAAPKAIEDPAKYSDDVMQMITSARFQEFSKSLSDTIGQPNSAESLQSALRVFDGKRIDYSDKALDNKFGNGLRQIVYYLYVENFGFVYFRFNWKRTSQGWVLAHLDFKTETNEMFPKDFTTQ